MKLFNRTRIDDKVLERFLYRAAKAVGSIRTFRVVVVVKNSRCIYGRVKYTKGGWGYYRGWLKGKKRQRLIDFEGEPYYGWKGGDEKLIFSEGGFVFLYAPLTTSMFRDPLEIAESFYQLAAHEWCHVRDGQKRKRFGEYARNWKNRPHERRAVMAEKRAVRARDRRSDIQDAILDLALEIECLRKEK